MKERFRLYHIGDARPRCIAYTEGSNGGSICGKPTVIVDEERGGMVCAEHAPKKKISSAPAEVSKQPSGAGASESINSKGSEP